MKPHHKKKALIGIPVGLGIEAVAAVLIFREYNSRGPVALLTILLAMVGFCAYFWGCLALAKAKGYSSAIMLTVVLGGLFPMVVLLALPDKYKHHEKR